MNIEAPNRLWLPRTGQTTSYVVGDDGYFQAGNPRATRFVDNGNGTISDRATGLQWVKQPELIIPGATGVHASNQIQAARGDWANSTAYALADLAKDTADSTYWVCVSAHTSAGSGAFADDRAGAAAGKWRQTVWTASAANLTTPATMNWANAVGYCLGSRWDSVNPLGAVGLNYAGFADWRLPNSGELSTLVDIGIAANAMIDPLFINTQFGSTTYYWSSSTNPFVATYAYYTDFTATTTSAPRRALAKTNTWYLRPVRGGRLNAYW